MQASSSSGASGGPGGQEGNSSGSASGSGGKKPQKGGDDDKGKNIPLSDSKAKPTSQDLKKPNYDKPDSDKLVPPKNLGHKRSRADLTGSSDSTDYKSLKKQKSGIFSGEESGLPQTNKASGASDVSRGGASGVPVTSESASRVSTSTPTPVPGGSGSISGTSTVVSSPNASNPGSAPTTPQNLRGIPSEFDPKLSTRAIRNSSTPPQNLPSPNSSP